jgi:hypothetical protein
MAARPSSRGMPGVQVLELPVQAVARRLVRPRPVSTAPLR